MKKSLFIIGLIIFRLVSVGCPACGKNQSKLFSGITHGTGPDSNWDYVSVWITILLVLATLFYTMKWLIKPGEKNLNHIKRTVLN